MNADRLERLIEKVLSSSMNEYCKLQAIKTLTQSYKDWAERQYS